MRLAAATTAVLPGAHNGPGFAATDGKISVKSLFDQVEDARSLAQIIVDTVREPLLVLDGN